MILPVWGWFAFCALFLAFAVDALVRGIAGMGWLLLAVASCCLLAGIARAYGKARGRKPRMLSLDVSGWSPTQPGQQGKDDGDLDRAGAQSAGQRPERRADEVSSHRSGPRLVVASSIAVVLLGLVYWQARSAGVGTVWSWLATGIVAVAVAIGMIVAVRRSR